MLIIGAAGGNEIQASLFYGAGQIDAVELNPVTVSLLRGEFADYSGNLTEQPNVNYVQGDGRTFLARSDDEYDLIWFVAPDSYAASNAATSGAFVLSESYLYTEEMIESAYDHLSADGVIVAQFGDRDFAGRPMRTARYFVTAREALAGRIDDFAAHTVLVHERGRGARSGGRARSCCSVRRRRRRRRRRAGGRRPGARRAPAVPARRGARGRAIADLITLPDEEVDRIVADYPLDISAIDDDRPFFWHFTPFGDVITDWQRSFLDAEIAIGERLLVVLVVLVAVVAFVLLWLPFLVTRRRAGSRCRERARPAVRVLRVARPGVHVRRDLDDPALRPAARVPDVVVVGVVVRTADRHCGRRPALGCRAPLARAALPVVTAALVVLAGTYVAISDPLTETALAWPQWARITVVFVLLFPVGLLLGVFLPTGMDAAVDAAERAELGRTSAAGWSPGAGPSTGSSPSSAPRSPRSSR